MTADRHVVFAHDGKRYALALSAVRQVSELSTWSRVPRAPAAIVGVTSLHGRVAMVVDLGPLLGGRPQPVRSGMKLVVLSRGDIGICAGDKVELAGLEGEMGEAPATVLDPDRLAEALDRLVPEKLTG